MEIEPDTKNWTWVLERPCPECGLDTRHVQPQDISALLRDVAAQWAAILRSPDGVRQRPSPTVWSPLEYGCHVRDVFRIFDGRLQRMLAEDDPLFPDWDQDATAMSERYNEQDPSVVAGELTWAGTELAARFDGVQGDAWQRNGRRSDGAQFTVATFARYLIHDPIHHLHDVTGRQFDSL